MKDKIIGFVVFCLLAAYAYGPIVLALLVGCGVVALSWWWVFSPWLLVPFLALCLCVVFVVNRIRKKLHNDRTKSN